MDSTLMATTMNCSVNVEMNKTQVDFGKERMIVVGRQDSFMQQNMRFSLYMYFVYYHEEEETERGKIMRHVKENNIKVVRYSRMF